MRKILTNPQAITTILFIQLIPLVIFPLSSFTMESQEWWLPVVLVILVIIGVVQLVFRKAITVWPWDMISFAQGFNIISRLMLLLPHANRNENGLQVLNTSYIVITLLSIVLSALLLWYTELPDVRLGLLRNVK
jgi:hypothetical protein